jgi:predicted DNA-binding transcriptional regulator AlpA
MEDQWLDIDQAVTYLRSKGVKTTRKSLYSMVCRLRQPKSYKIGRALRFKQVDLDEWVASITRER